MVDRIGKLYNCEIEKKIENNEIAEGLSQVFKIILSSINDWPTSVLTLYDYEMQVEGFINNRTTKINIEKSLKAIDFSENSWQAESLTQILDVFQFYKSGYTLKKILDEAKNKIYTARR